MRLRGEELSDDNSVQAAPAPETVSVLILSIYVRPNMFTKRTCERLQAREDGETLPPEGNKISLRYSLRGPPRSCAKADRFRRAQGPGGGWIRRSSQPVGSTKSLASRA